VARADVRDPVYRFDPGLGIVRSIRGHGPLGMDSCHEQRFRAQDVADPGDQPLIEQGVTDRSRRGGGEPSERRAAVEARVGQIRAPWRPGGWGSGDRGPS